MRLLRRAAQELLDLVEILRRARSRSPGWRDHVGVGRRGCSRRLVILPDIAKPPRNVAGCIVHTPEIAEGDEREARDQHHDDERNAENDSPWREVGGLIRRRNVRGQSCFRKYECGHRSFGRRRLRVRMRRRLPGGCFAGVEGVGGGPALCEQRRCGRDVGRCRLVCFRGRICCGDRFGHCRRLCGHGRRRLGACIVNILLRRGRWRRLWFRGSRRGRRLQSGLAEIPALAAAAAIEMIVPMLALRRRAFGRCLAGICRGARACWLRRGCLLRKRWRQAAEDKTQGRRKCEVPVCHGSPTSIVTSCADARGGSSSTRWAAMGRKCEPPGTKLGR